MKYRLVVLGALCISNAAFAKSNDVAVGLAFDQGLSAVVELGQQYRLTVGNDGIAADYLFKRGALSSSQVPIDWYVGAGAWAEWDDEFGVRIPIGLDWTVVPNVNIYGQLSPQVNFYSGAELQLGAAVGVTYRF
ncbi:hypothetical protein V4D10_04530 [Vibrio mimicus]|uniref:hypothetical protein n=1 Tax=Vibrio mimicus TaxID=674 RepID=UPI002F929B9E